MIDIEFNHQNCKNLSAIYSINNLVNKKRYIGSTTQFYFRMKSHYKTLINGTSGCIVLQRAFDKYGEEAFEIEILEININQELLHLREQHYIELYKTMSYEHGYNIGQAGKGSKARKRTIEECKQQSERLKLFYQTKEGKEAIRKVSDANRGRKTTGQALINIQESIRKRLVELKIHWNKGRTFSEEHKKKLSDIGKSKLGDKHSSSKIKETDAYEILYLVEQGYGSTEIYIKLELSISRSAISKIKNGTNWSHLRYSNIPEELLQKLEEKHNKQLVIDIKRIFESPKINNFDIWLPL